MNQFFRVLMVTLFVLGCSNSENTSSTQNAKFSEELSTLKEYFRYQDLAFWSVREIGPCTWTIWKWQLVDKVELVIE
ncbi:hypothetical protein [Ulvibacterium sp.]|uniref:hypothetical protein n=1 Tax=Ulvibacterium sp. TaxID=2665914 RepID=UPI003CC50205